MDIAKFRFLALIGLVSLTTCSQRLKTLNNAPGKPDKVAVVRSNQPHPGRSGTLTARERQLAEVAWVYFKNNTQEKTGLVNAVNKYPSTTMWDTASYLGGLTAAYELGLIEKHELDTRLWKLIETFNTMKFFRGELPNKAYHTQTAERVNYANKPGEIGFSALDLGRLLIWLRIIKERYPGHGNGIDNFLLRWNWCRVVDNCGTMYGAFIDKNGKTVYVQEGRLGYEEYAAKGFQLWGFSTAKASLPEPYAILPLYDIDLPYDSRDPRKLKAHNYVVCESYVLDGIELNWDLVNDRQSPDHVHTDTVMADYAQRVYQVQERRFFDTGIFTARTEHQLDGPPYFVYDTIYTDGFAWNTITEKGEYVPQFAAVALKGAFGLWSLWDTPYTDCLFDMVADLYDSEKGFYEGRYEKSGGVIKTFTSNNNGIILETLLYKTQGKLLRFSGKPSRWDSVIKDPFQGQGNCLPNSRKDCGSPSFRKGAKP